MRWTTPLALLLLMACGDKDLQDDTAPHETNIPDDTQELIDSGDSDHSSPPEDTGFLSDQDADGWDPDEGDCDDADPTVHPGADELCNGQDDDCDGQVDEEPCSGGCDVYLPYDFGSIQDAIDALPDGATVCLDSGHYYESFELSGRSMTIRGIYGSWATIIDGQFTGSVARVAGDSSDAVVIEGLTLINGAASGGGGLSVDAVTTTLTDINIMDCSATSGGGLAIGGAAEVEVTGLVLRDNTASQHGGALHITGSSSLWVTDLEMAGNEAGTGWGAGLYASDGTWLEIETATCEENIGAGLGGTCITAEDCTLTITDLWASENEGKGSGGAVAVFGSSEGWLSDLILEYNDLDSGTDATGGGLFAGGEASLDIQGLIIRESDIGSGYGGALYMQDSATITAVDVLIDGNNAGYTGAIQMTGTSNLSMEDCTISDNDASWDDMIENGGASLQLTNCSIVDNTARTCSALMLVHSTAVLDHVLIGGNRSTGSYGGAICSRDYGASSTSLTADYLIVSENRSSGVAGAFYVTASDGAGSSSTITISHALIVGNGASDEGGAFWLESDDEGTVELDITSSVIASNYASSADAIWADGNVNVNITYSDIYDNGITPFVGVEDPTGSDGNVSVDPELLDTSGDWEDWDLHLAAGSALIDAGDPSSLDPDGTTADMGAYGGTDAGAWDLDGDGYPLWWQPGPYDSHSYPAAGWDCDDGDETVYPGAGC
jgi:hypothetical protein